MTDTRFTTAVDDTKALLTLVDLDEIGDLESLLMLLLARPVSVEELRDEGHDEITLEVFLYGKGEANSGFVDFPMSLVDLVRSCAEIGDDLIPYGEASSLPDVRTLAADELLTVAQRALGKVRLLSMSDRQR